MLSCLHQAWKKFTLYRKLETSLYGTKAAVPKHAKPEIIRRIGLQGVFVAFSIALGIGVEYFLN